MEAYDHAFGPCGVCGKLCEEVSKYWDPGKMKMKPGSLYWTPLPDVFWNTVRQFVVPLFSEHHVQNVLYFPEHSKPFCGPACALMYTQGCGSIDDVEEA